MSAVLAFALHPRCTQERLERAVSDVWTRGLVALRTVRGEVIVELGWFMHEPADYIQLRRVAKLLLELSTDGNIFYYRNAEMVRDDTEVPERRQPIQIEDIERHKWLWPTMEFRHVKRIRVLPEHGPGE